MSDFLYLYHIRIIIYFFHLINDYLIEQILALYLLATVLSNLKKKFFEVLKQSGVYQAISS